MLRKTFKSNFKDLPLLSWKQLAVLLIVLANADQTLSFEHGNRNVALAAQIMHLE